MSMSEAFSHALGQIIAGWILIAIIIWIVVMISRSIELKKAVKLEKQMKANANMYPNQQMHNQNPTIGYEQTPNQNINNTNTKNN